MLTLATIILVLTYVLEVILLKLLNSVLVKRWVSGVIIMFSCMVYTSLVGLTLSSFAVLLFVVGFFRLVHVARFFVHRHDPAELKYRSSHSVMFFGFGHLIIFGLWYASSKTAVSWLSAVSVLSFAGSVLLGISYIKNVRSSIKDKPSKINLTDDESPTVTVCVPARNETEDLPFVVSSILENDYLKLEILVLDDCSHDKTPEIIKSFAHKGVRFISGSEPGSEWLPKNWAYNRLFEESSSEYLIFMGVDTRLSPNTIRATVAYMQSSNLVMLSVLPKRVKSAHGGSSVFQLIRYWWELAVPSLLKKNRPPALSTYWAVKKSALSEIGGFKAYQRSITPETHIARRLKELGYKFVISSKSEVLVTSTKSSQEQRRTALRVRYPSLRRRPEIVAIVSILQAITTGSLITSLIVGGSNRNSSLYFDIVAFVIQMAIYLHVTYLMGALSFRYVLIAPFIPILDIAQTIVSMIKYEFGDVSWKDRNICMPIIRYEKSLPKA